MSTRRKVLLLLRKHPGATVNELASSLGLTGMGVRRHLDALVGEGFVESIESEHRGVGRPAAGWHLTDAGLEVFPRRYDSLALDILEDVAEHAGPGAVDAVLVRRTDKLVADYQGELNGSDDLEERVDGLAHIRDEAGYLAESGRDERGELVLTENNCAIHRVAEQYPGVCAMELALLRRVMGPDVEVVRSAHIMSGDAVCRYQIRPNDDGE